MKIRTLFLFLTLVSLTACSPTVFEEPSPLRIGREDVREIVLHRLSNRQIILEGGNGKYKANVADSRIASLKLRQDTLTVAALFEGETFAMVTSHDQEVRVDIKVVYPQLKFSTDSIRLFPTDQSKFVSLFGGDPYVKLLEDDPDEIIDIKWDGTTHLLEINAHYEGEARVIAQTQTGEQKTLKICVKAEDEPVHWGIYGTGYRYLSNSLSINNMMVVHRPQVGIWISSVANPHGGFAFTYAGTVLKIAPIVRPQVGSYVDVEVTKLTGPEVAIAAGAYRAYVEKVTEQGVLLRHRRFKFFLPYDQ